MNFRGGLGITIAWIATAVLIATAAGTSTSAPLQRDRRSPDLSRQSLEADFDVDGQSDRLSPGPDGTTLVFHGGEPQVGSAPSASIDLGGTLLAWAVGDLHRADAVPDLAVVVDGTDGPWLRVYEGPKGVMETATESIPLPRDAIVEAILIADLAGGPFRDVAVVTSDAVFVLVGRDRQSAHPGGDRDTTASVMIRLPRPDDLVILENPDGLASRSIDGPLRPIRIDRSGRAWQASSTRSISLPEEDRREGGTRSWSSVLVVGDAGDASDVTPGDGVCATPGGPCTLRAAIEEANALPGSDTIEFDLGSGVPTISPLSALPALTEQVVIDGGTGGATRVELSGALAGSSNGLLVQGSSSIVRSLVVNRFALAGIRIEGASNIVVDCWIGPDAAGGAAVSGNGGAGIQIVDAPGNIVGGQFLSDRNVISNNTGSGVLVDGTSVSTLIRGNMIGLDPTGTTALPNTIGVELVAGSSSSLVGGPISVPGTGLGNVIAGNFEAGVRVVDSSNNVIVGNLIGLDPSGQTRLGDADSIEMLSLDSLVGSNANTVGGEQATLGNVVAGIRVAGGATTSTFIEGNKICHDLNGTTELGSLPGLAAGIVVENGGYARIGGDTTTMGNAPGNAIAGCTGNGILVGAGPDGAATAEIYGNLVGLTTGGSTPLANASGIVVDGGDADIGRFGGDYRNAIAGNTDHGIHVIDAVWLRVHGNSIGLTPSGMAAGNGQHGLLIESLTANFAFIGGNDPALRNHIGSNGGDGIHVSSGFRVEITGNFVGLNPSSVKRGNGGCGVYFGPDAHGKVGGEFATPLTCDHECNRIADNGSGGICVDQAPVQIQRNLIYDNQGLGIDHFVDGVTSNDSPDQYPLNHPVVLQATVQPTNTTVVGYLQASPDLTYDIDVYATFQPDPSGHGEGDVYLGTTSCDTDVTGQCVWTLSVDIPIGGYSAFTATTLDLVNTGTEEETSEFAANVLPNLPLQPGDPDLDQIFGAADNCPDVINFAQEDTDGDGAGDLCDCAPSDSSSRSPAGVVGVVASKTGSEIELNWQPERFSGLYSVERGDLSSLAAGSYGGCLATQLAETHVTDAELPQPGDGLFYLVRGQSLECGPGTLGFDSLLRQRALATPPGCPPIVVSDFLPKASQTISGSGAGSFILSVTSDDQYLSITEEESGGSPASRTSLLDHRWTIDDVTPGSFQYLYVEGQRTDSLDGDDFVFEVSADGGATFVPVPLESSLPLSDDDVARSGRIPTPVSGSVIVRVIDTDRTGGNLDLDTVSIDWLFVRVVQ